VKEATYMPDYPGMYRKLFNALTDAINILQAAQQETEEMYMSAPEANLLVLRRAEAEEKGE